MKDYDYAMVRECQARVAHIANKAEQARRVGVEPSTWHRWLDGAIPTPLRGPRVAIERFLGVDQMPPDQVKRFLDELAARWPRPATTTEERAVAADVLVKAIADRESGAKKKRRSR